MLPVLQQAARHGAAAGAPADVLVLLQPTSPLRTAAHVDAAVDLLDATGADAVVSVMEVPHQFNPVSVLRVEGDRVVPLLEGSLVSRRQDKPRLLARNGPAVLAVRTAVVEGGTLYGDDCRPLLMDAESSLDIDTPADFDLLDFYLTRRR
jgi:CMP-N-acetylneuraminic acid synthetase